MNGIDPQSTPSSPPTGASLHVKRLTACANTQSDVVDIPEEISVLGNASLHHGACLLVMRELLLALCTHAQGGLKPGIAQALRAGTDEILARADDKPLPASFYHALLAEMNGYLNRLR